MCDEDITTWNCPITRCDGKLIRRENDKDRSKILGCTNYPRCDYTQKCEKEEDEIQDLLTTLTDRIENDGIVD